MIFTGHDQPGRWADRAACHGMTKQFEVPLRQRGRGRSKGYHRILARAKTICDACPVKDECLAWAMSEPDPAFGLIAAGLSPDERREIRKVTRGG